MSKIKELSSSSGTNLNIIEVFKMFSPEGKTKYVDMFLKVIKNTPDMSSHVKEIKQELLKQFPFMDKTKLDEFGDFEIIFYYKFLESMFTWDDLKSFRKFCEYNERGLIEQNDVSKYKSFDEIQSQLQVAEMKVTEKEMEKQIIKLREDKEWLILRPLTFESSKKYGANTKWCTTQENNPDYYYKYSKKGVLIYILNKKHGYKVASFYSLDKNDPEFSWWNQKDSRIDSFQAEITDEIRMLVRDVSMEKGAKTNDKLSDNKEEISSIKKSRRRTIDMGGMIEEREEEARYEDRENIVMEQPVSEQPQEPQSIIDRMSLTTSQAYQGTVSSDGLYEAPTPRSGAYTNDLGPR